jgi:hypothetical protein
MPDRRNLRTNPLTPRYRYNTDAGRYTTLNGKFVSQIKVVRAVARQITATEKRMLGLSEQLKNEEIDLQTWRNGMLSELKTLHLANAAAAKGGWAQMTPADYGRVGGKLARQYEYLNRFASQIQYGTQPLDGRFTQRVKMYAGAARDTYQSTRDEVADALAFDEERNVLGNAEHCDECVDETGKGWVPIGSLKPIGGRLCKTNCKCRKRYRNSKTGKTFE